MAADFLKYLFGALAGGAESAFGEYRRREDLKREEADKAEARAFRNKQFDFQQKQFDTGARGHRIDRAMSLDPGTELTESLTRDFTDEGLPIRKEPVVTEDSAVTPLLRSVKAPQRPVIKSNPFISDDVKPSVSFGGQAPVKEPSTVIPFEGTGMRGEMKGFRPLTLEEASRKAFTDAVNADTGMDSGMRTTLLGRVAGINTPTPAARTQPDPRQQAALQLITGNPDATVESLSPEQALKFFQMTGADKADPLNEWTMISGALGFGNDPKVWTAQQRRAILNERERLQQKPPSAGGSGAPNSQDDLFIATILKNPQILDGMTPTARTKLLPTLIAKGFNEFGRPMSENATFRLAETASAVTGLQSLKQTIQEAEKIIGPVAGWAKLNPYDANIQQVQGKINLIRQRVGKALEGGVLRKEDEEKYKLILATVNDLPEVALSKIDNIIATLESDNARLLEFLRLGGFRVPKSVGKQESNDDGVLDLTKGSAGLATAPKPNGAQFMMRSGGR